MICKTFRPILAIALLAALFITAAPVMAQQTVDPSGSCTVNNRVGVIDGQTGTFYCLPSTPGGASGLWTKIDQVLGGVRVAHAIYNFAVDGGAVSTLTPSVTASIPANAIVFGALVNSTTAVTSGGAGTLAVGTTAGSSTTSILGVTAKTSLSLDAIVAATPVFTAATSFKMTAAGSINVTIATAALTAGVVEVFVFYIVPTNA